MTTLEANNTKLVVQVVDLEVEIAKKNDEIRQLHTQSKESLDWIQDFIGNSGNVVNKACLFDNEVKTEGQLSTLKIVNVLVEFAKKMEATLVEMRKLLPGPRPKLIRLPIPSPKGTPQKNRVIVELKTPVHHCHGKESAIEVQKVVAPASPIQVKPKMTERESETLKTTSFDPSLRRISTKKKKKEPTPEPRTEEEEEGSSEDVEELELVSSNKELELEDEEAEPATPPPEKTKLKTRTSERKKSTPIFKTLGSSKRLTKGKTPKKGESS